MPSSQLPQAARQENPMPTMPASSASYHHPVSTLVVAAAQHPAHDRPLPLPATKDVGSSSKVSASTPHQDGDFIDIMYCQFTTKASLIFTIHRGLHPFQILHEDECAVTSILSGLQFLVILRVLTHVIIGFLFGYLYRGVGSQGNTVLANYVYMYGTLLLLIYTGKMPVMLMCKYQVVLQFPLEFQVVVREYFNRWYSLPPYLLSVALIEIPIQ
ncbi:hypothetical protein PR048_002271, partial [Dryococelus australis]